MIKFFRRSLCWTNYIYKCLAARELAYELSEYLSRRYPDTYRVTRRKPVAGDFGWYGDGEVEEIHIVPVNATYNLAKEDPMKVASLL